MIETHVRCGVHSVRSEHIFHLFYINVSLILTEIQRLRPEKFENLFCYELKNSFLFTKEILKLFEENNKIIFRQFQTYFNVK